jgi:serine/threonine protein kinase/WD40 repeat protein
MLGGVFVTGDLVDQYQVLRLLGRGGVGEVWLARDQVLGRKVALKILRPDVAGADGRSLNDLLEEARANAAVVHPNVVTVYAVGSFRGAPYLALEYLDGSTLRERMSTRRPTVPEALRFARDIAAAVAAAHETGVLHLDLKPDNVLLAADGRLRVVDFGLARLGRREDTTVEQAGMTVAGTPAYMGPEIWRGEPPSDAADAWAFGVVLCELLSGQTPYPHESIRKLVVSLYAPGDTPLPALPPDVPGEVRDLLAQLLRKDPTRRPSLVDVERVLADALARERAGGTNENPYRGLHPFRESDAARYFGREDEIEAFVARLEQATVLPIVGHSGAGKSSFVRAGVIPRLRERGAWIVVDLRPGPRPFSALSRALRTAHARHSTGRDLHPAITAETPTFSATDATESGTGRAEHTATASSSLSSSTARPEVTDPGRELAATLQQAPERLYLELAELARSSGKGVLLVVDQLEEAATLVNDEAVTDAFLRAIAGAADDVAEPVRVICTLRDDYLGRLAAVPAMRGAFAQVTVLRRPDLSMLVESVIAPLVPLGVAFDDGNLPLEMARAVEHEPAALPLLSFTCSVLWERRNVEQRRLLRRVYVELGGVVGALAAHAESVFSGLSPSAQRVARNVLLGLVTEDRTRRRRSRRELVQQNGTEAAAVIERFVEARLLTVERSTRDDDSEVELAHEALVNAWARLTRFLDEDRDQVTFLADVQQAADGWVRRGRRPSELWRGAALGDALSRIDALTLPVPDTVRGFLDAAAREQHRRKLQRSAATGGLVTLLFVVAVVLFVARGRALDAADEAKRARAVAEREAAEAALVRGDVWPARAKLRTSLELDDNLATRAVWRSLDGAALLFSTKLTSSAVDAAFGPDGTAWVASTDDRVFAYAPGTFIARDAPALHDSRASLNTIAVLGQRALVGERDAGTVALVGFDRSAPNAIKRDVHGGAVIASTAIPSRSLFLTAGRDGTVRSYGADGEPGPALLAWPRPLQALAARPNGTAAVVLDDDGSLIEVAVPGVGAHPNVAPVRSLGAPAHTLAALPDGGVLVGFADGRIGLVDARGDQRNLGFLSTTGVARIAVDPRGSKVALRDGSGALTLWSLDATRVPVLRPLAWFEEGGEGGFGGLTFDPTGTLLLSTNRKGEVRVWRVDDQTVTALVEPRATWMAIGISDDGSRVAEVGDVAIVVRSVATGEALASIPTAPTQSGLALNDSGDELIVGVGTRAIVYGLDGHTARGLSLTGSAFSDATWLPGGTIVVTTRSGTIEGFPPGATTATLQHATGRELTVIERSVDGRFVIVGGSDGFAAVLDASTLSPVRVLSTGAHEAVTGVGFSTDAGQVAVATEARIVVFALDGSLVREVVGEHIAGACTGFDRRGRVIAMRATGSVAIDVGSGAEEQLLNVPPTGSCEMNGGGRLAMRLGDYVLPYDVSDDLPLWLSRGIVNDVIETHRTPLPWAGPAAPSILALASGEEHLCTAENRGVFVLRSRDGSRVLGRTIDAAAPLVLPTKDGCVWLQNSEVKRLRAAPDGSPGGVVDVVSPAANDLASDGVVVAAVDETSVRVVLDGAEVVDRTLPLGAFVPDEFSLVAVEGRRIAAISSAGLVAVWQHIDDGSPPLTARVKPGDYGALALGPGQLVAVGFNSEAITLIDAATSTVLIEEGLRGAPTFVDFARRDGRLVLQAGTNLGRVSSYDVEVFVEDRCATLRRVWKRAPMVWEQGRPQAATAPADHACAR